MKILSNKAYRELITEKELTELSLKSLKSKYEFISDENKKLHSKNDFLHIEIKSLREKAEKYDIYLQKSKARKAKARAKAKDKEPRKEFIELINNNIGKEINDPEVGIGHVCGYAKHRDVFVIGLNNVLGWTCKYNCKIFKEYKSYWFISDLSKIEETTTI